MHIKIELDMHFFFILSKIDFKTISIGCCYYTTISLEKENDIIVSCFLEIKFSNFKKNV